MRAISLVNDVYSTCFRNRKERVFKLPKIYITYPNKAVPNVRNIYIQISVEPFQKLY